MKTILIIEDNKEIRENISEILELADYKVITASNGKIGVETALQVIPDLILCDITMPVLDGFGVLLQLNKNPLTAGIPFIFLTAKTESDQKKFGIDLGADDYITKPFESDLLIASIKKRIEKHEKIKSTLKQELLDYIKELEDMLHMTSHRVRSPLCACMGLMDMVDHENYVPSEDDMRTILSHMKSGIAELDSFTRELTTFMNEAQLKKKNKLGIQTNF